MKEDKRGKERGPMVIAFEGAYGGHAIVEPITDGCNYFWAGVIPKIKRKYGLTKWKITGSRQVKRIKHHLKTARETVLFTRKHCRARTFNGTYLDELLIKKKGHLFPDGP